MERRKDGARRGDRKTVLQMACLGKTGLQQMQANDGIWMMLYLHFRSERLT